MLGARSVAAITGRMLRWVFEGGSSENRREKKKQKIPLINILALSAGPTRLPSCRRVLNHEGATRRQGPRYGDATNSCRPAPESRRADRGRWRSVRGCARTLLVLRLLCRGEIDHPNAPLPLRLASAPAPLATRSAAVSRRAPTGVRAVHSCRWPVCSFNADMCRTGRGYFYFSRSRW